MKEEGTRPSELDTVVTYRLVDPATHGSGHLTAVLPYRCHRVTGTAMPLASRVSVTASLRSGQLTKEAIRASC